MGFTSKLKNSFKWFNSAAGLVSSILLLISFILMYIAYLLCNDYINNTVNVLICISTNLLGIIVTVSFVQHVYSKQDDSRKRLEEKDKIMRYHTVLDILIKRYCMFYVSVTTPLSKRNISDLQLSFQQDFKFEDMRDLYKVSDYITDGILSSSIELFYKEEELLRGFLIMMSNNIDFKYYPDILRTFLSFINSSLSMDVKGTILGNVHVFSNKKKLSEIAANMIAANPKKNWEKKYDSGNLNGNLIVPYVILFKLMKKERQLIIDYLDQIKKLS